MTDKDMTLYTAGRFSVKGIQQGDILREYVDHPGAVIILPWLDANTILLIKNKRVVVGEELIELPAGTLEPAERAVDCAARELIEETGYEAKRISRLFECYSTPGFCNEKMYFFEAKGLNHVGQNLDPTEEIEVIPTPFEEARKMACDGRIADLKTIAALLFPL